MGSHDARHDGTLCLRCLAQLMWEYLGGTRHASCPSAAEIIHLRVAGGTIAAVPLP
jgi:hypothetical protein